MTNKNQVAEKLRNVEIRLATLARRIETNPENSLDYVEAMKVTLWRFAQIRADLERT
jgi:hypothetical protein